MKQVKISYWQQVYQEVESVVSIPDEINIDDPNELRTYIQEELQDNRGLLPYNTVKEQVEEDLQDMVVMEVKEPTKQLQYVVDSCFEYGDEVEAVGLPKVRLLHMGHTKKWMEILENPTEEDILNAVERAIITTGDKHHVFFEGIDKVDVNDSIPTYELCMGS